MRIQITRDPDARDLPLPAYQAEGAAGLDLRAAVAAPVTLAPGERALIPTGVRVAVPDGYEAQVRPRSGLAWRHGLGMVNAPGTIDHGYTGPVRVILINLGREPITIARGERVAQLVVCPVARVAWEEVERLPETARGEGGFGSTGHRWEGEGDVAHPS